MVICYPHFYPQGPAVLTSGPVSPEDLARLSGQPAPWRRFQCRGWRVLQGSSRFNPPEAGKKQSFVLFLGRIMMRNGWIWACLCFQTSPCHHISAVTVRIRSTIQWKLLCFDLLQILMFLYVSSTFCREFLFGEIESQPLCPITPDFHRYIATNHSPWDLFFRAKARHDRLPGRARTSAGR